MADSYKDFQREPSTPHQCVHESEMDGARCRGMAMANNYMCYAHRTDDVPTVIENDMFLIDDLSTHEAIQKAFCDVAGRLASNHIDLRRAELLITLLRAASRNLRDANTARRQAAAAGAPGSTASSSTLGSSPAGSFQNCQPALEPRGKPRLLGRSIRPQRGKFFSHSRNGGPRSSRFRANSTVAFRKPSLSPASWRLPS